MCILQIIKYVYICARKLRFVQNMLRKILIFLRKLY